MGILKHLFFWPVTGPTYLARFSMEKVQGVVKEQLTDVGRVKEELLDLQLRYELGDVDEEEYVAEETRLMEQLREVRRWREEFGMGTRGGVVQMASAPEPSGDGDDDEEPRAATGGASLEITLDWDEDEDEDDGGGGAEPDSR